MESVGTVPKTTKKSRLYVVPLPPQQGSGDPLEIEMYKCVHFGSKPNHCSALLTKFRHNPIGKTFVAPPAAGYSPTASGSTPNDSRKDKVSHNKSRQASFEIGGDRSAATTRGSHTLEYSRHRGSASLVCRDCIRNCTCTRVPNHQIWWWLGHNPTWLLEWGDVLFRCNIANHRACSIRQWSIPVLTLLNKLDSEHALSPTAVLNASIIIDSANGRRHNQPSTLTPHHSRCSPKDASRPHLLVAEPPVEPV